jgi:hypothetical protein
MFAGHFETVGLREEILVGGLFLHLVFLFFVNLIIVAEKALPDNPAELIIVEQ